MISRDTPLPLYYQVEMAIRERIERGELVPGQALPTEEELQVSFAVSRNTVRSALDRLVSAGIIQRMQGKGTFVAKPKVELDASHVTSMTGEMLARGMKPSTQVLRVGVEMPSPNVAKELRMEPGEKVVCLDRLRYADDTRMAIIYDRISLRLVPDLVQRPMESESLCEELDRRYGIVLVRSEDVISATLPTHEQAELLQISENDAILSIVRVTYDANDNPILFSPTIIRGDMWRYHVSARGPYTQSRFPLRNLGSPGAPRE